MKVVVAGPRYKDMETKIIFDDYHLVVNAIRDSNYKIDELVSGNAVGVDRLGETYATATNTPVKLMPITSHDWSTLGKRAGMVRNRQMAEYCDAAVIVWDGVSKGTRNMINEMIRLKKPYYLRMTMGTLEDFYD